MRTLLFAATIVGLSGCAGTSVSGTRPPVAEAHKTPVARELPNISQKVAARRFADGQVATGKIDVEGPLNR